MARPVPVGASAAVELTLVGPSRTASVVAATTHAVYLQVGAADVALAGPLAPELVCLASADAVRVPCALLLGPRTMPPAVLVGTPARVGLGQVTIEGGATYRVQRWWRPPQPRGLGSVPPSRVAGAVRWLAAHVADPLDTAGREAVTDLVAALATAEPNDLPVDRLLGRGPGLTPTGDDVLAGALVTLRAFGSPAAGPLARAVRAAATDRTSTVSAGLLRHATDGRCIPQLAQLLTAIGTAPAAELARAAGALLAVGHCSGAGLLHGVLVGVAIAHRPLSLTSSLTGAPGLTSSLTGEIPAISRDSHRSVGSWPVAA